MQTHPSVERRTPTTYPRRGHLGCRALLAVALVVAALRPAAAGDLVVDGSFVSTVPTGTPPLSVASTTQVDGLNADLLDGFDASAFARTPAQVLVVSPSGGDFNSVQDALDAITDASQLKPYLIRVGPGIYTGEVTMKPYVDVEGSGEGLTILRAFGGVTVTGASNAEIRDLMVENAGDGIVGGTGIHNLGVSMRVQRVTVKVQDFGLGTPTGIHNEGPTPPPWPYLRHVTVSASGRQARGIRNDAVPARIFDSEVSAIGPDARAIMNVSGAHATLVRIQASASSGGADDRPVDAIWSSASGVRMVDVEAKTVGGLSSTAIRALNGIGGTGRMKLIRVLASAHGGGGVDAYGIYTSATDLELIDCEVFAGGATTGNFALLDRRSNVRIFRSGLTASGSGVPSTALQTSDPGGDGSGSWVVDIHASQLWGSTRAVLNAAGFSTRIGGSSLGQGTISNSGTLVCAGVYDDAFTFYFDSCP